MYAVVLDPPPQEGGKRPQPGRRVVGKALPHRVTSDLGKIQRDGYILMMWKGDHGPRHVHVYRDSKLVVKWDLEARTAMKGKPTARILELIRQLEKEGIL